MSDPLKKYERELFGGHDAGEIFAFDRGGAGLEATMYMMDAEYDPVRITFDIEGGVKINADNNKWVNLTPSQLRFLAGKCKAGVAFQLAILKDEEQNETEQ